MRDTSRGKEGLATPRDAVHLPVVERPDLGLLVRLFFVD